MLFSLFPQNITNKLLALFGVPSVQHTISSSFLITCTCTLHSCDTKTLFYLTISPQSKIYYCHSITIMKMATAKKTIRCKQGATKRCRLSWLTNSALVCEPKCGGGSCGFSANEYSCIHRSPNKLGRSTVTTYLTYGSTKCLLCNIIHKLIR
jgi:hypothetical protein